MLYEQQFINKTIVQSILAYKRKKILKQSYSIGYMLAIKKINVHFAAEGVSIWCVARVILPVGVLFAGSPLWHSLFLVGLPIEFSVWDLHLDRVLRFLRTVFSF